MGGLSSQPYPSQPSFSMDSSHMAWTSAYPPELQACQASSRNNTMLDSQGLFFDFAGQQLSEYHDSYGGPHRYSSGEMYPDAVGASNGMIQPHDMYLAPTECLPPLEPREVNFDISDPHDGNLKMSRFDNIGAVLRHRSRMNARRSAYWILDQKGKEIASITWDKLGSRAEKVAQVIRDKSNLYRGDRVALVYRDVELIEFIVAFLGCFLAGVVAVPMNSADDYQKLILLLNTTQAHLALTTDDNLKAFHRDISNQRLKWPAGVEWWKTNEFGTYQSRSKSETAPIVPAADLAYIEFSQAPTGNLRGVVLSHRTIMHQMAMIQAIVSTVPTQSSGRPYLNPGDSPHDLDSQSGSASTNRVSEVVMSYLEPRAGPGLILTVLHAVYAGNSVVWFDPGTVEQPGLYAHLITKYRASILVADYIGLKNAVYNYQQDPMATRNFKKSYEPNFSALKLCLIDTLTVDTEFHEILADRWLRPLRNNRAREVVAPMLCLIEYGGMIISVRDWLGGIERMGCRLEVTPNGSAPADEDFNREDDHDHSGQMDSLKRRSGGETSHSNGSGPGYASLIGGGFARANSKRSEPKKKVSDLSEILLDMEALKANQVVILAMGSKEVSKRALSEPDALRVGAFGFPIPDTTLALVDPETNILCPPGTIGELWVDSPSLSGGFWALPKHTEIIFHARPYRFVPGEVAPVMLDRQFLRTGLLGCIVQGKVFVLGFYEDRIRQRVECNDSQGREPSLIEPEFRFFFVQHLVSTLIKTVPRIYDCSAFDSQGNGEYLLIVLIESQAASIAPTTAGGPPRQLDVAFLDSLAERVMQVLYEKHQLRVYCVMTTAPNTLPRTMKNGLREIGNMLCRRDFDNGTLACVHVKFGIERSVQNLMMGDDPVGGIWSPASSAARAEFLSMHEKQYTGIDHREVLLDDRTSTPLNQFSSITDLLQFRVTRQPDEMAYCTIDFRGKEGKSVSWRKFDLKVAAYASFLMNKVMVKPGENVMLMYSHSEEFVRAVHACFYLGVVVIPMAPVDQKRLNEDAPTLLHMIADFKIRTLLVNNEVENVLKLKAVSQHLKHTALILRVNMPIYHNTSKLSKQTHGCRELGLSIAPAWVKPTRPVLVWVYWTPDQRRVAVQLDHRNLMSLAKVQRETCQMNSTRPVLGCIRSTVGLGFIHTFLMGIFLGTPTYLVSPVYFAQNPNILFQTISRYKIKDTYATAQLFDHVMAMNAAARNSVGMGQVSTTAGLHELKNLMISVDGRPRVDLYQRVRMHFAQAGLDRTAINTIYSHVLNPMIASRSYMCMEPIELWLDLASLRRGLVVLVEPGLDVSTALLVQDAGMVPVSTQISIVNPETNRLCLVGEYGEIWVSSAANAVGFYGTKDDLDRERFGARPVDGDSNATYVRTGDFGFLHTVSRPVGPGGAQVEMQVLFVLGSIGETFEVNGLNHFPIDIETSVTKCHRNIVPGGCAVFHAGGLVVVLVEIFKRDFIASIVPIIVNTILNHHQFVVDIVAFVSKGDFPRSRLGEKQRGKILGSWVGRKLRTVAQFSIKNPFGAGYEQAGTSLEGVAEEH